MATIQKLEFSDTVTAIPDYCFANTSLNFSEFTISTPQIGKECFNNAWVTDGFDNNSVKLTLTDEVTNIGAMAFERCLITDLYYDTNAVNGAVENNRAFLYGGDLQTSYGRSGYRD